MKLGKYSTYSSSEVDWLQNYPSKWVLKRLKDIATIKTGERNTEDKVAEGKYPFFVRSQIVEYIDTYSFNGEAILTAGDGVGVAKVFHHYIGKFETHQRVYRISHFKKVHGRFLFYFLMENLYKEVLKFNAKSTVDSLRLPMFQRFPVFLPPYNEQIQIASFIDSKTNAIDKKIELLEQKTEYYKELSRSLINEAVCKGLNKNVPLKDSGIEWIGEIPKHWKLKRLKDVDEVIMGQSPNSDDYNYEEFGYPFLQGNAEFGQIHPEASTWCQNANKIIKQNDILVSVRAPIGAVNIADKKYGIGRGLCAVRSKKSFFKFLYYHFLARNAELNSVGTGTTYTAISVRTMRDLAIAFPPFEEQTAIAEHLDKKTTTIDAIVANIKLQIDSLKELRKTLINDVVTGKLKVTEDEKG